MLKLDQARIGIIGLGYVGLPLAVSFGRTIPTVGFDINRDRVEELRAGTDGTLETSAEELAAAVRLEYTCELEDLRALQRLCGDGADTDRQRQAARSESAGIGQPHRRCRCWARAIS